MKNISFIAFFICISGLSLTAQVTINEYSASNLNSFIDSYGKTEDWIELYNASDAPVDISGWHLSDKESKPIKWKIPSGTIIAANGHLLFLCSGRDLQKGDEYHTNFKLAQSKGSDIVLLSDASGNILEMHDLDLTLVEHSRCRSEDGGDEWVIGTSPSYGTSNNGSSQVNGYTATPTIELEAGFYTGPQTVSIVNNESNSTLRYTLNGDNVTSDSPEYTDPISVENTQVVKARSFSEDSDILPGKMDFSTFFIDEEYSLAVFSVAADEVINLANGDGDLIPIGSLEYFNTDKEREATSFGSLNRHGQDSWILDHRSIDWISRDEMGYSKAVDAELFGFSDRDEYQKFMFRNSGDDNYPAIDDTAHEGSTHIRDEYVQTLGQLGDMHLDQRAVERVVVFFNGQYWGVYGMRDRPVDHDYTDFYYDQGKYDIQYLSTWQNTEIEYGGLQAISDWEQIRNHILLNDMSDADNYQIAEDSIDMLSLIDYMTMNLNVVASDWLNYNTGWWRGLNPDGGHKKWGYILWDLDATFDYYINYSGVPDISPNAKPCDIEDIAEFVEGFFGPGLTDHGGNSSDTTSCQTVINGSSPYPDSDPFFQQVIGFNTDCCDTEWTDDCQSSYDFFSQITGGDQGYGGNVGAHEQLFIKLIEESPIFRQLYYSRYADLMNTVFTCENMTTLLDSMLAVIEPEMPRQIERWGGTMSEWESNVQDLKNFIEARCLALDDTALECFDELDGPYQLTLQTRPNGVGEIDLNTLDIESFPWIGNYFGGMENKIKAKVFSEFEDDYVFSHWESSAGNVISPSATDRKANIFLVQQDTLTAVFDLFSNTNDISDLYDISVYPNPASAFIHVDISLDEPKRIEAELISITGKKVQQYTDLSDKYSSGENSLNLPISESITSGMYYLSLKIEEDQKSYKINIIKE